MLQFYQHESYQFITSLSWGLLPGADPTKDELLTELSPDSVKSASREGGMWVLVLFPEMSSTSAYRHQ